MMKKFILLLPVLIFLTACSSLELQGATSADEETQRILALGLSHEENLSMANNLTDPHMVTIVSLQLTNAHDDKIQAEIDAIDSAKIADNVIVSDSGLNFIGPEISKSISSILSINPDLINYHLEGSKNLSTGLPSHKLKLSLVHNSDKKRGFISANLCDQWNRCEGETYEIKNISAVASNCSSSSCDFNEIIELELSDNFLRDYEKKGFTFRFNANKSYSKLKVSKAYLTGYLKVVQ
jgi:hypothetical protein